MKISDYVPEIYKKNLEMNGLMSSEETEFEQHLKPAVANVFKDTFVKTATLQGIENFEKLFSIIPDPTTETIDFRRARLFNRLISQIPFTERFLQGKFNEILGPNTNSDFTPSNPNNTQWYYLINYNNYTMDLYVTVPGRSWLNELKNTLKQIVPCNILWTINVYAASWQQVKEHFLTWQEIYDRNMTWQDVMDALWLND